MYTTKSFIQKNDAKTIDLPDCPVDTISCVSFNLENTHVAISSWDGSVKLYRLPFYSSPGSNCTLEKSYSLSKPVLSCCFFNNMLLAGLSDGSLVAADSNNTVKAHDSAIKSIQNFNNQFIITGSFDSTLKFWDLKSSSPFHTIALSSKVYAMDLKESVLVVALGDKTVVVYDMNNVGQPVVFPTRFNYSIRSVAPHKDQDSFAVGGIEAKVETFSRNFPAKKMVFRCHRVDGKLYAVNVVRFLPNDSRLIVTGGSDGSLVWFDRENRSKLCSNEFGAPITAGEFSNDGKYFIFAVGDDWSKGYTGVYTKTFLKMIIVNTIPGLMK